MIKFNFLLRSSGHDNNIDSNSNSNSNSGNKKQLYLLTSILYSYCNNNSGFCGEDNSGSGGIIEEENVIIITVTTK